MAWCRQAASHYLNQCWSRSMLPYGVITPQRVNTLRLGQNCRHFADIFKFHYLQENASILLKISNKFVPKVRISNFPVLVQIMARRRPGNKPLSESIMVSLLMHICVIQPEWVNNSHCFWLWLVAWWLDRWWFSPLNNQNLIIWNYEFATWALVKQFTRAIISFPTLFISVTNHTCTNIDIKYIFQFLWPSSPYKWTLCWCFYTPRNEV